MKLEEFQEKLESNRSTPLFSYLTKYQHIERLGNSSVEGLLDGKVYVQNKIDGANLTVACISGTFVICSRNRVIYKAEDDGIHGWQTRGEVTEGFNGAVEYVLGHYGIQELAIGYILRGEWTTPHAITYDKEFTKVFLVFDVQRHDMSYLTPDVYEPLLKTYNIMYVPILKVLDNPTLPELMKLSTGPDDWGAQQKEGIVIKRYDFVNKYGRITWGKIVQDRFKDTAKAHHGVTNKDANELKFSALITPELVMKNIKKIEDGKRLDIKQMPEVLGRVYNDVFTEELWDFVMKNRVKEFNFSHAKKLCDNRTRELALRYFNGID